ncbi:MAG: NAD(+) synthase [Prevotella sp.]|nr:NAD(+) synthase [Prevotella sp.]
MKDGFIRGAAASIDVLVADPKHNCEKILETIQAADARNVKILVCPELVLTAYTCGDIFLHRCLLDEALVGLNHILNETAAIDMLVVLGMPLRVECKLYNCAIFLHKGKLLGIVPKRYLPNYSEFYEARHFAPGMEDVRFISLLGQTVPFGMNLLFCCDNIPELVIAAEVCEDLWVPLPPSTKHALAGATVICNPSASDETVAKMRYRQDLVVSQSARLICAYIYASAGNGESTQDVVYSGHHIIAENGSILNQSPLFSDGLIDADIDLERLAADRRRMTTFETDAGNRYHRVSFHLEEIKLELTRSFSPTPFIPSGKNDRQVRCEEILSIQAMGLKKRLQHTRCRNTVLGISGGLDSTLALLVTARAYDLLGLDHKGIHCITMPCFGTTNRTYQNALRLAEKIGASVREVRINKAVMQHFIDIGHDPDVHDVTYENSQARERTQILMDIANQVGGLVIGTGDLSELALGWATYNGDHMSMYAVNSSVPKTLVRHLVQYCADSTPDSDGLGAVLLDILDTPVSPELLPPENGVISQITEDIVGPYELHDFFLYYTLRFGFPPKKVFRMATLAFAGSYSEGTIYKWLRTFYYRFFSQQFKRSCLPDGPKVGSIAVSPRGDLRMPSDASSALWMREMEKIKETITE